MRTRRHIGLGAFVIIVIVFFAIPLISLLAFSFTGADGPTIDAWASIVENPGFYSALGLSLTLAVLTTIASLILMTATVLWVHLRAMHLRALVEGITLLVFAIPAITLVIGATGLCLA